MQDIRDLKVFESKYHHRLEDNYDIGAIPEDVTREVLIEEFGLTVRNHFVFEPGIDVDAGSIGIECVNWGPGSFCSSAKAESVVQNFKGFRTKVLECTSIDDFSPELLHRLRRMKVHFIQNYRQITNLTKRSRKWLKNSILSQLLQIPELFLIYKTLHHTYHKTLTLHQRHQHSNLHSENNVALRDRRAVLGIVKRSIRFCIGRLKKHRIKDNVKKDTRKGSLKITLTTCLGVLTRQLGRRLTEFSERKDKVENLLRLRLTLRRKTVREDSWQDIHRSKSND